MPKKKAAPIQSVKGMHDVLPEEQLIWDFIIKKGRSILEDYGFSKIDSPILEQTNLFERSIGEGTDVVDKEMFNFKTKGGDNLTLRPEFTASFVRAYIEHGMSAWPHPVKLYGIGPVFRYGQPQGGRLRQFNQLNSEIFGDETPAADAEQIFILCKLLNEIGIKNTYVKINSIGDKSCRSGYIKALKDYYRPRLKKVCPTCKTRFKKNIMRMLDCGEEGCRAVSESAPQALDYLDIECKNHFKLLLEFLDEAGVPYILDHRLARGLDYYTRTVFEIWSEDEQINFALAGGGRYDYLVELLGGYKTSACGWAMGIERIILAMKALEVKIPESKHNPKVFLAQLGDLAKKKSLVLFEELRKSGIPIQASFGRDSIKSQLRIANKLGAFFTLILGQREALDGNVILRDMESSAQELIRLEDVVEEIRKRLKDK